jgi:deoxyadenosine/deoxycytidine kinase
MNDNVGSAADAMNRYGFAFQMYMLTTRLYQMEESARQASQEGRCVFLDRGAVGDTLFALQSYKVVTTLIASVVSCGLRMDG